MGKVINLQKVRKARARADRAAEANANAARHGRSKAEQAKIRAVTEKARSDLDGHKKE